MKIAITGSSGFVGSKLVSSLTNDGHAVAPLVRKSPKTGEILWDPDKGVLDPGSLAGVDGIIHLAGEGIASGRWTAAKKERIKTSRVQGTALLAKTILAMPTPPKVWISASAIGFYGDRGDEPMTESSPPGKGFLADVCQQWEAAANPAADRTRIVHPRIGVVLGTEGGALAQMLTPFKMGVGGAIGSGKQWMSWIAVDELVNVLKFALTNDSCRGPVNAVTPNPKTNADFGHTLGKVLHRPSILPMPAFAARLAFGEMADELLLSSTRVKPNRLTELGYSFQWPDLEGALHHVLKQ